MYGLAVAPLVGCVLALGGVAGPLGLAKTLAALCAVSAAASALLTVATAEWAVAACGSGASDLGTEKDVASHAPVCV